MRGNDDDGNDDDDRTAKRISTLKYEEYPLRNYRGEWLGSWRERMFREFLFNFQELSAFASL